jgi:dienelactone hydrolase
MRLALGVLVGGSLLRGTPVDTPLDGTWEGYWARAGDTLAVTLVVRRDGKTAPYVASFSSERLRVDGIPFAETRLAGCCAVTLVLRGDQSTLTFTGTLAGDSLTGTFREGDRDGSFRFHRAAGRLPAQDEREITFPSGPAMLSGTLLLPAGNAKVPAVVFLHGSGPEGRWASRFLATRIAARGMAALIFDKRGVGASTGDWRTARPEDLALDGAAAVDRLATEPRIDAGRIGIHGHSQGGTLAPLVVAKSPRVAFVVGSAAGGAPLDSIELFSIANGTLPAARTADDTTKAREYLSELVAVAYRGRPRERLDSLAQSFSGRPWFFALPPPDDPYWAFSRAFAAYDPLRWWSRVKVPVLLLYGAADARVPAKESASRIEAALRQAGNRQVTTRIFPDADHTFRLPPGPSGWPVSAPGYLSTLLDWLSRR